MMLHCSNKSPVDCRLSLIDNRGSDPMPTAKKTPAKAAARPAKASKPAANAKAAAPKAPKSAPRAELARKETAVPAAAAAAVEDEVATAGEVVDIAERKSPTAASALEPTEAPAAVTERAEAAARGFGDLMALHKAGIEAFVQAGSLMFKGMGEVNNELVAFARTTTHAQVAGAKALAQAKSLEELMGMHAELTRSSLERLVTETNKLGALAFDTASKTSVPLADHWNAAFKTFTRPASA
jgi:hypothetical protein